MAYETQLDWTNKMFTGGVVMSLKKTHAGRSQGAKHAELHGVNEGQIRAGRWNNDALMGSYLTHLPRKFMRSMADLPPSLQGIFFLPWARILPPRSFEQAVWPFINEWLAWFDSAADVHGRDGDGGGDGYKMESSYVSPYETPHCLANAKTKSRTRTRTRTQTADRIETGRETEGEMETDRHDFAAQGLLRLLLQPCIILLQDSVIMRRELPNRPI
jgi:hypothetical protein